MANYYDCSVRIYLPLTAKGQPLTSSGYYHYDLQIDSLDGKTTLPFDEHTPFLYPVFSYYGRDGVGHVRIFNASNTQKIYVGDYLLCKFAFKAIDTKFNSFLSMMKSMLSYRPNYSSSICPVYQVISGPFQTYTTARYNTFGATAIWSNTLGMSALYDIYNSAAGQSDHTTYAAWTLFNRLYESWQFAELAL